MHFSLVSEKQLRFQHFGMFIRFGLIMKNCTLHITHISIVCDIFKNHSTIRQTLTENVRSSFKAKIYDMFLQKMAISLVFIDKELILDIL